MTTPGTRPDDALTDRARTEEAAVSWLADHLVGWPAISNCATMPVQP